MLCHSDCTHGLKLKRLGFLLHSVYQAIGSRWVQVREYWAACEYCEYWNKHPYLRDPDGIALCAWCWHFQLGGGIFESEEHWWCFSQYRLRREGYLQNFRVLPVALRIGTITQTIASF